MGKSMRGEPDEVDGSSASEQNKKIKSGTLSMAVEIIVGGGPHPGNHLEEAIVDLAEVAGNSPEEVAAAVEEKRPKFNIKPLVKP